MAHQPAEQADIDNMARLRVTDFLPKSFDGNTIDYDVCHAHFLSFHDYLIAHDLNEPNVAEMIRINNIFKTTLVDKARLWAEGKVFNSIANLRDEFLQRFSPAHSNFGHVKYFNSITHIPGQSAEQTLNKIKLAAQRIGYGDQQIKDKFLQVLPPACQAAVIMAAPVDAEVQLLVQRAQQFFDFSPANGDTVSVSSSKQVSFQTDQVHLMQKATTEALSDMFEHVVKIKDDIRSMKASAVPSAHTDSVHLCHTDRNGQNDRHVSPHGHLSRDMHRSHRSKSNSRDRYANGNRSHSRYRSASRSPYRDYGHSPYPGPDDRSQRRSPRYQSGITCHFCKRPNHKWRNCYSYQAMIGRGMNPAYYPCRPASGPPVQFPPPMVPSQLSGPYDSNQAQPYPFHSQGKPFHSRFEQPTPIPSQNFQ